MQHSRPSIAGALKPSAASSKPTPNVITIPRPAKGACAVSPPPSAAAGLAQSGSPSLRAIPPPPPPRLQETQDWPALEVAEPSARRPPTHPHHHGQPQQPSPTQHQRGEHRPQLPPVAVPRPLPLPLVHGAAVAAMLDDQSNERNDSDSTSSAATATAPQSPVHSVVGYVAYRWVQQRGGHCHRARGGAPLSSCRKCPAGQPPWRAPCPHVRV